jgi:Possible hemagglutinin (DUF637)
VCIQTANPPAPRQNWLARHPLFGGILRIAIASVCVAAGPGCAPFAPLFAFAGSAAVAGLSGGNFTDAMHAGTLAFVQAVAMNGVGGITDHTPAFGSVPYFENVIGHALVGCLMATASGSTCGSGAAAGAVPAFAGPLINDQSFSIRSLVANSTLGGLASLAGGGKFANGAVTGAFGYLFNAAMGRAIGGAIGAWGVGAAGLELEPLDAIAIAGGRFFGGIIGSAVEDFIFMNEAQGQAQTQSPPPTNGDAPQHGGDNHDDEIQKAIDKARADGAANIRKNQVQTDINGNRVGGNRPDLQYDLGGQHYNVEFDNVPARGEQHGIVIQRNDPSSVCILRGC